MTRIPLGLGAMSPEIVHAIFRYSDEHAQELMLISSKSQIDHGGGYVNNWTTGSYSLFVEGMRRRYPRSRIKVCRDHCGPGFNGIYDLADTHRTISTDIEYGFDLIHIDFCHYNGDRQIMRTRAREAIELCLSLNPGIELEIGTDDNVGAELPRTEYERIQDDLEYFTRLCHPTFYVVQTGSLTKELRQVGRYNHEFILAIAELLHDKDIGLKEHNADYLTESEIAQRVDCVDAMNIAPQLGVVQTSLLLNNCLLYGIDTTNYINRCYEGGRWKKWLHEAHPDNKLLCALIAGHYHFASDECRRLRDALDYYEDFEEAIINKVGKVINHYLGKRTRSGEALPERQTRATTVATLRPTVTGATSRSLTA